MSPGYVTIPATLGTDRTPKNAGHFYYLNILKRMQLVGRATHAMFSEKRMAQATNGPVS